MKLRVLKHTNVKVFRYMNVAYLYIFVIWQIIEFSWGVGRIYKCGCFILNVLYILMWNIMRDKNR